jgi:hypothetical protein
MKIKKLDKRHTGYGTYKFLIEFSQRGDFEKFFEARNWCWETWGPGVEVEYQHKLNHEIPWAWQNNEWNLRIYLATDKEANWWKLKWGC